MSSNDPLSPAGRTQLRVPDVSTHSTDEAAQIISQHEARIRQLQDRVAELTQARTYFLARIEALEVQLEEKAQLQEQLNSIHRSTGWALLQVGYSVRFFLFPPDSRRERMGRFCAHRMRMAWGRVPRGLRDFLRRVLRRRPALPAPTAPALPAPPSVADAARCVTEASGVAIAGEVSGLVSVILPVYNQADLLRESIESVLSQTYSDIELIVLNDGSTDGINEVLAQYAGRPRVRVLTQPNQKLPKALSNAFEFARGEFWTWTSADNLMEPAQIERQVDFLRRHGEAAMVYANYTAIDDRGLPLRDPAFRPQNRPDLGSPVVHLPHDPSPLNTVEDNFIGPCFMYRAWAGRLLGEYAPEFGLEDYDYWMRMNRLFRVAHLDSDEPLYRYRVHDNTISAQAVELKIQERVARLMQYERQRRAFYDRPWTLYVDEPTRRWIEGVNRGPHTLRSVEELSEPATADVPAAQEAGQDAGPAENEKRLVLVSAAGLAKLPADAVDGENCVVAWLSGDPAGPYEHRALVGKAYLCFCPDKATAARLGLFHSLVLEAAPGQCLFDLAVAFANNRAFYHQTVRPEVRRRLLPAPFRTQTSARVLVQVAHFAQGGMEQVLLDLLAVLLEQGFEPALLVLGDAGPGVARVREMGVEVLKLPEQDRDAHYIRLLRERRFGLVNAHFCTFGARAAAELGVPYVQTIHSCYVTIAAETAAAYRESDPFTTAYVCTSSTTARYADLKLGLSPRKMVIIPNGLDPARLQLADRAGIRARLREKLGLAADDFVFLHVGSIYRDKGQKLIVAALAEVLKTRPRAKLVLLGGVMEEAYLKELQQEIRRLKLEQAVVLAGYSDEVAPFYAMADAFVLPSFWEGWSLALGEAVYMGLPVIATAAGSAPDLLPEVGGHLLRPVYDSIVDVDIETAGRYLHCDHSRLVADLAAAMEAVGADPKPPVVSEELRNSLDRRQAYGLHARLFEWLLAGGDAAVARRWTRTAGRPTA